MFTGLIQHTARILSLVPRSGGMKVCLSRPKDLEGLQTGESIAVNGVCLSLEAHDKDSLTFYAQAETLTGTTLRKLRCGQVVNMERALRIGDRIGGHFVQGHVGGIARIASRRARGQSVHFTFSASKEIHSLIVKKGSVSLDGISLTVSSASARSFSVDVIPLTLASTNIKSEWKTGRSVNIETDILLQQKGFASAFPEKDAAGEKKQP